MNPNLPPNNLQPHSEDEPSESAEVISETTQPDEPNPPSETEERYAFRAPAKVEAALDAEREEFERQFDILDSKAQDSTAGIREKLAKKGIRLPSTPEEVEAEALARIAAHAAEVHEPKTKRSKTLRRPVRYVSARDKGPPEHIAKQMRGEEPD